MLIRHSCSKTNEIKTFFFRTKMTLAPFFRAIVSVALFEQELKLMFPWNGAKFYIITIGHG